MSSSLSDVTVVTKYVILSFSELPLFSLDVLHTGVRHQLLPVVHRSHYKNAYQLVGFGEALCHSNSRQTLTPNQSAKQMLTKEFLAILALL